jgi:hypothetical protein
LQHLGETRGSKQTALNTNETQPSRGHAGKKPHRPHSNCHVRALLGDRVADVVTERRTPTVDHFADGPAFRRYFKSFYGPTISAYRNIDGDADRVAALDIDIARLGDGFLHDGSTVEWEYLLVIARKG